MLSKEEEQKLIRAILDGDKDKFAVIVKEYQDIVANLTYRMVGNKLEVDDVVQQVFVELYLALPRFRFESKLNTFIFRITVNTVNKLIRTGSRYVQLDDTYKETLVDESSEEELNLLERRRKALQEAIDSLKEEQRTALVLYTYEDFSYNDIAEVMGASLTKVESLIFRARKNLKKKLEKKSGLWE